MMDNALEIELQQRSHLLRSVPDEAGPIVGGEERSG